VVKTSYAMAENVFAITQSPIDGAPRRIWVDGQQLWNDGRVVPVADKADKRICFVSSGRCIDGNQIRIVCADGTNLPEGRVGEIMICSDSLFGGYYNRPDLSTQAFQDGWYWSAAVGFVHDGALYVSGCKKDLIIGAGKDISHNIIAQI